MKEPKIEALLNALFQLKYSWKSDHSTYTSDVINKEGRTTVEQVIRQFLLENRDEQLGVLEAKVLVYEEIIAKSTFAPMLPKEEDKQTEIAPPYKREMLFTQTQIEHLASKVFHLTGGGEVMSLFYDLLGEPCSNSTSQN